MQVLELPFETEAALGETRRPDHDQHTMGGFVHSDIKMDAACQDIHVGIGQVTCRPLAVVFLPGLLQALDRRGG